MNVAPERSRDATRPRHCSSCAAFRSSFPACRRWTTSRSTIARGEVHMLLGENGAGKSTLMKVLCGAYRADAGELFHNGKPAEIASPADARKFGIAVIFQEFTLVPYLDIAQNIFLGREFRGRVPGFVDRKRLYAEARRMLDHDRLRHRSAHAGARARRRAAADGRDRQGAVAERAHPGDGRADRRAVGPRDRAPVRDHRVSCKQDGVAIVYISHRLAEVFALGDRITVLRDGRKIASVLPCRNLAGRSGAADGRPRGRPHLCARVLQGAGRRAARGRRASRPTTASRISA